MFRHRFGQRYKYQNTRQYLRLPISWPVKCEPTTQQAQEGRHVTATQDVSAGGMRMVVREEVPVDSEVILEIHVPPLERTIQAVGKVLRCQPSRRGFELGVRFERIDPRDQVALNEAVEQFYSPRKRVRHQQSWWRRIT